MKDLTKLEYFAVMAMQGMLSNSYQQDAIHQRPLSLSDHKEIALMAVQQAKHLMDAIRNQNIEDDNERRRHDAF